MKGGGNCHVGPRQVFITKSTQWDVREPSSGGLSWWGLVVVVVEYCYLSYVLTYVHLLAFHLVITILFIHLSWFRKEIVFNVVRDDE